MSAVRYVVPRGQQAILMTDRGNHYAVKGYATTHNMFITVALHLIINTGLRYLTVKKERIAMSPMRYVVHRGKQICLATDRETHSAVKEYANNHNMTMTAALHLIINRGLRFLILKEEKAERDYEFKVLQLGREFLEKEKRRTG